MIKLLSPLLILTCSFAQAANIVSNPGFETGDVSGWTLAGTDASTCLSVNSQYCGVDNLNPHTGAYAGYFAPVGGSVQLSQLLTTTSGAGYDISFWLSQDTPPSSIYPNSFAFSFGGNSLVAPSQVAATNGYTEYSFSDVLATSTSSNLLFSFRNDSGFFDLDDVSVSPVSTPTPVPEPAIGLLLVSGILLLTACVQRVTFREN